MAIPETLSHYQIEKKLGSGGMGEVYLARDLTLDRPVALKVLPSAEKMEKERLQRFIQEARAASALSHANVVHVYEIGCEGELHFIAMEYVEGVTLESRLENGALGLREILEIAGQVADALEEAHACGITHRDIKPANIMITPRGHVKVLDFGLAKMTRRESASDPRTDTGLVLGSVQYMSPEQAMGKPVDHRTDLFSLGIVLYQMGAGRLPFSAESAAETVTQILHAEPEAMARFNLEIPAELERMVRKCLEKERDYRYQSARDLRVDLENLKRAISAGQGSRSAPDPGEIRSLAVFPLENRSGDPEAEYLSDGITERLINTLSQLSGLRVMGRSTVFKYKGLDLDPREVGRTLHVDAVLTGRVAQHADEIIVKIELADVAHGWQIWGDQFVRKLADIYRLETEISTEISEKLSLKISGTEKKRLSALSTENADAYREYLRGRHAWNKRTEEGVRKAIACFRQAIEKDPCYALAYTGLADCYHLLAIYGALPPREAVGKARASALRALELDSRSPEARTSLAWAAFIYDWDWSAAGKAFEEVLRPNPSYATAHHFYAFYLTAMGKVREALEEIQKAQALDPLSLIISTHVGLIYYLAHRYDDAVAQYGRTLEMDPGFAEAHLKLGETYKQESMHADAIREIEEAIRLAGGSSEKLAALGHAYAVSGQRARAEEILKTLTEAAARKYVSAYDIGLIHAGLGNHDLAFQWLEKAHEERALYLVFLKVDPRLDPLRTDPRFEALKNRMGF